MQVVVRVLLEVVVEQVEEEIQLVNLAVLQDQQVLLIQVEEEAVKKQLAHPQCLKHQEVQE